MLGLNDAMSDGHVQDLVVSLGFRALPSLGNDISLDVQLLRYALVSCCA